MIIAPLTNGLDEPARVVGNNPTAPTVGDSVADNTHTVDAL